MSEGREKTYVYVISRTEAGVAIGPTKIGISRDPKRRLASLQTSCPYPLRGVFAFRFGDRVIAAGVEQAFHRHNRDFRTSGEWFDIQPITALYLVLAAYRACADFHGVPDDWADRAIKHACYGRGLDEAIQKLRLTGAFH